MFHLFFFLFLTLPPALSAGTHRLGIDDFISLAMHRSPDLNVSRADYNASVQRVRNATGDYLPRVDLQTAAGVTGIRADVAGSDTSRSSRLLTGTLSASQLLYDFGKTGGTVRASRYDANASFTRLQQKIRDKVFQVKEAYYHALKTKKLIEVNRENVKLNEQQLHRARRYFEAGIRTRIDVTDARVNLISARLALQNAHYEYRRARIRLAAAVGIDPYGGAYELEAPQIDTARLYESLPDVNQSFAALEGFAYAHRYTLKTYREQVKSAREKVVAARAGYFPGLYARGDYTLNDLNDELQLFIPKEQWNAAIALKWNLFEGFKTEAKTEEYRALRLKNEALYSDAKLKIRQEIADAQVLLLKTRDSVKLSQSLAEAAREKFVQAQKRYEHGLSDYIELQQARQGYIDASANLVTNYYDFYIALARRDKAIGK